MTNPIDIAHCHYADTLGAGIEIERGWGAFDPETETIVFADDPNGPLLRLNFPGGDPALIIPRALGDGLRKALKSLCKGARHDDVPTHLPIVLGRYDDGAPVLVFPE